MLAISLCGVQSATQCPSHYMQAGARAVDDFRAFILCISRKGSMHSDAVFQFLLCI